MKQFLESRNGKVENVSRETIVRLKIYQGLLESWQKKMNLVSSNTLSRAWERHFLDSLQLLSHLPHGNISLLDMGSGAGFPGLVLALSRPEDLSVTLVESDLKKCLFLENVSRETKIPLTLLRKRIEVTQDITPQDVITARALAPLSLLLKYARPFLKEDGFCLFLKGKDVAEEIQKAQKKWEFELEIFPSMTDSRAKILKITHPRRIRSHV